MTTADQYTPSVEEARGVYATHGFRDQIKVNDGHHQSFGEWKAEFDRMIEAVRAEAWEEGERAGGQNQLNWDGWRDTKPPIENPYRKGQDND